MTDRGRYGRAVLALLVASAALLTCAPGVAASTVPLGEMLRARVGWRVNASRTREIDALAPEGLRPTRSDLVQANICALGTPGECQPGEESATPGGFSSPRGVAVQTDRASPSYGDVYVADTGNYRIQELTPSGSFVSMFGRDVNRTKDAEAGATQAERDICTEEEIERARVHCGAGMAGTGAGALDAPFSIAVDPVSGDVYIQEIAAGNYRVDRYSSDGHFVWMAGGGVNETWDRRGASAAERNLCTAASGNVCGAGTQSGPWSHEPDAFDFIQSRGNVLDVGPEDVLYVGDHGRVQKIGQDGAWVGELPLRSIAATPFSWVTGLAVDRTGSLYIIYPRETSVVRKLDPAGAQVGVLAPKPDRGIAELGTVGLDPSGGLAVGVEETVGQEPSAWTGSLYDANSGNPLGPLVGWGRSGVVFGPNGEMYAAALPNALSGTGSEVLIYTPLPFPRLVQSLVACEPGKIAPAEAALECAVD